MHPSLEHLLKIINLEIEKGHPNTVVIGGLPKMLAFWEPAARRNGLAAPLVDELVTLVRAYPDQAPTERAAAAQKIVALAKADESQQKATPPTKPPTPQRPTAPQRSIAPQRSVAPQRPPAPQRESAPQRSSAPQRPPAPPKAKPPQSVLDDLFDDAPAPLSATPAPQSAPALQSAPAPEPAPEVKPTLAEASAPAVPSQTEPAPTQPAPMRAQPTQQAPARPPSPPKPQQPPRPQPPPRPPQQQRPQALPRPHHPSEVHGSEEPLDPRPRRAQPLRPVKAAVPLNTNAGLDAPLTVLHGIGPETAKKYEQLGLVTLRDLLLYFPRRYDDYSKMKTINRLMYGEECSVVGMITQAQERRIRGGQSTMYKVVLSDTTGQLEVSFFNQTWLKTQLTVGKQVVMAGRVDQYLGRPVLVPHEWELLDRELLHTGRMVPVYRLTQGITSKELRKITAQVTQYWAARYPDPLPADIVARNQLLSYSETLKQIHFPDSEALLREAQHRLAFDELLLLQLGLLRQKQEWQAATGQTLPISDAAFTKLLSALPYTLTGAQQRSLTDIRVDLARAVPMNRLLQGDVGSGKTAVAALAMGVAVLAGKQAAIMAPTSILAEQHYQTLSRWLTDICGSPEAIRLLQGATPAAEKAAIRAGLQSGAIKIIIGTHAIIEEPVTFANLGVIVIDEQHRFGVAQRAALRGKGHNPHMLVMTATPIPRSLALTVYGDLDLSVLDEMPPGRLPIQTHLLRVNEHERGYAFLRNQVQKGRQAFIIFPLVEESDKSDAKAAVAEHERLQTNIFRDLKLGLLHGRMKPDEKDAVMAQFRAGEYHMLVSTSVIEVGVDIPNASVVMIEGANRFGLAQLHQFRGRVGRGEHASYCLLASDAPDPESNERLTIMEKSQDGFYLAEKDMELRGPGDFLGTRQAGFASAAMAHLTDLPTIEKARREARLLFEHDPGLQAPEYQPLAAALARFWEPGAGDVS